jgi:DNA-binding XRE family transcriptional regulator
MKRGLTASQAANQIGINLPSYSKVERGLEAPSRRVARELAMRYRMKIDKLLAPI